MERILTICIVIIISIPIGKAQKILKQYTADEGLSEIKCFDIFQDSKGYIWIGTSAGANKFDGKDFIRFDRSNGLLSDHIYSFYEDSQNRIWINNMNGEPLYIKDDIVYNRFNDPILNEVRGNHYYMDYVEDKYDRLWLAHRDGYLNIMSSDSVATYRLGDKNDFESALHGIVEYNDEIIVITSFFIKSINPLTYEVSWNIPIENTESYFRNVIHEDKLYLMNLYEAYFVDLETKEYRQIERLDGGAPIYDVRVLYDEVLISTKKGISILNDVAIENYTLHPTFDSIAVTATHEDMNGDVWIATRENGAYTYYNSDVKESKYSNFCNILFMEEYSGDSIFIIQDDWKISLLVDDELKWNKQLKKIDENEFNSIFYNDGELWVVDKFHMHMDVEGDYRTYRIYNREVFHNKKSNEFSWINTRTLSILDNIEILFKYDEMHDLMDAEVDIPMSYDLYKPYDFEVDNESNLWIGGEEGLFYYANREVNKVNIPEVVGSVVEVKLVDDSLLMGINYGNGLFLYDIHNESNDLLTRTDGLPSRHFTHLDVSGKDVWASYSNGICQLRIEGSKLELVKNYGLEHGVPKGRITMLKIIDGLCHFVVNGHAYSIKSKQEVNDVLNIVMDSGKLSYFENESKTVNFDCINHTFANRLDYKYRLLPHDSIWKETNGEKIDLEYIPAGEYELQVRAYHPLIFDNPIKTKPILIQKRWYNENYLRCMVLLFFGLMLYFLIRIKALSFNSANFKHWVAKKIQHYFIKDEEKSFNIKDINGIVHLLNMDEIKFIKSSGNYLEYHTAEKKYVSRMTMSNAVEKFKLWTDIERVHRSYMVNFKLVDAIDHRILKVGSSNIPFTDRYREVIERKLRLS